jgi:hydrogenase-4 component E
MELIFISILILTFFAGESKNLRFSVYCLIANSLFIVIAVFVMGFYYDIKSLYWIALLDLFVRVLICPLFILKSIKNRIQIETKPTISHPLSIALSIVVISLFYHFMGIFKTMNLPQVLPSFACGITLFIYGLYLLISKNDTVKMVICFFIVENGIHLLIISLIPRLPKFIEFTLSLNFIVAISFFLYIILRLNEILVEEEIEQHKQTKVIHRLEE